jgi:hypothetical protein
MQFKTSLSPSISRHRAFFLERTSEEYQAGASFNKEFASYVFKMSQIGD